MNLFSDIRTVSIVSDTDLPRCAGRASPEVIDRSCVDDGARHTWVSALVNWEYGERIVYCGNCGREADEFD